MRTAIGAPNKQYFQLYTPKIQMPTSDYHHNQRLQQKEKKIAEPKPDKETKKIPDGDGADLIGGSADACGSNSKTQKLNCRQTCFNLKLNNYIYYGLWTQAKHAYNMAR